MSSLGSLHRPGVHIYTIIRCCAWVVVPSLSAVSICYLILGTLGSKKGTINNYTEMNQDFLWACGCPTSGWFLLGSNQYIFIVENGCSTLLQMKTKFSQN